MACAKEWGNQKIVKLAWSGLLNASYECCICQNIFFSILTKKYETLRFLKFFFFVIIEEHCPGKYKILEEIENEQHKHYERTYYAFW